jgi:AcrR family transcriptional regulator
VATVNALPMIHPQSPARGRPRSMEVRRAVLAGALDGLVGRGMLAMSIESVASRAKVSKATIYRWWPDKIALTLEALRELPPLPEPDTGSLHSDLRALRTALLELIETTSLGDVLPVLVAERRRSEHRDEITDYVRERSAPFLHVVQRAVERGELPDVIDPELLAELVASPLAHSIMFGEHPLDDRQWTAVIEIVIAGARRVGSTS